MVVIEPLWECVLTVIDSWCAWVYTMSGYIVFAQVGVKREEAGGGKILAKAEIDLGLKATTYDPEYDQTLDGAK